MIVDRNAIILNALRSATGASRANFQQKIMRAIQNNGVEVSFQLFAFSYSMSS